MSVDKILKEFNAKVRAIRRNEALSEKEKLVEIAKAYEQLGVDLANNTHYTILEKP